MLLLTLVHPSELMQLLPPVAIILLLTEQLEDTHQPAQVSLDDVYDLVILESVHSGYKSTSSFHSTSYPAIQTNYSHKY